MTANKNEQTPLRSYSQLNNFNQRSYTTYGDLKNTHEKRLSPFELRHHFSHKSIYSSKYTNNIIGRRTPRKDLDGNNVRSKSTINFYRSYTSHSFARTPTPNTSNNGQDVLGNADDEESNIERIFIYIPEDPAYSTPDGSNFFIFSGGYVRDTMCNSVFFFNYFGSIFTQFRPGHRPQKAFF
jgi:hypothetical protein